MLNPAPPPESSLHVLATIFTNSHPDVAVLCLSDETQHTLMTFPWVLHVSVHIQMIAHRRQADESDVDKAVAAARRGLTVLDKMTALEKSALLHHLADEASVALFVVRTKPAIVACVQSQVNVILPCELGATG